MSTEAGQDQSLKILDGINMKKKDKERKTQAATDDFSFGFAFGSETSTSSFSESFSGFDFGGNSSFELPSEPSASSFSFDGDFNFGGTEMPIPDSSPSISTSLSEEIKQAPSYKPQELVSALQTHYKKQGNMVRLPISGYSIPTKAMVSLIVNENFQQSQRQKKEDLEDKKKSDGDDSQDAKSWNFELEKTEEKFIEKVETSITLENILVKKTYTYDESFNHILYDEPFNRILIEVPLGNMSVLTQGLTWLWASRPDYFKMKEFKYVILVPMRLWLSEKVTAKTTLSAHLAKFIYKNYLSQAVEKEDIGLLETLQTVLSFGEDKSTLLILDGYHEVFHLLDDESSFRAQLLRDALSFKQVIVTTSDQHKPSQDIGNFDNELRIVGFQEDQIEIFFQNYFDWQVTQVGFGSIPLLSQEEKEKKYQDKEEKSLLTSQSMRRQFTKAVKENPQILEVVSDPLMLAFFCDIYGPEFLSSHHISPLIDLSLTSFCNKIAESFLKRYWQNHQKHLIDFYEFKTLRAPCFVEMEALGILAWQSFQANEIIFSEDTINTTLEQLRGHFVDRNIEVCFANAKGMGFLHVEPNEHKSSRHLSYCFVHSTFQEYFAAYHLLQNLQGYYSKVVYEENITWIAQHKYEPRNARVMGFLAGLTVMKGYDQALEAFWYAILSPPHDIIGGLHVQLVMRCLHEARLDDRVPEKDKLLDSVKKGAGRIKYDSMKWFVHCLCAYPILIHQGGIIESLMRTKDYEQESSIAALGKIGRIAPSAEIVTFLLKALENKAYGIRKKAAEALGQIGEVAPETKGLIKGLLRVLHEEEHEYETINILSHIGKVALEAEEIIAGLLEFIDEKENCSRYCAVNALGQIGMVAPTESLMTNLLGLLKDEDSNVRTAAAEALGQIRIVASQEKELIQGLLRVVQNDKEDAVCTKAVTTLGIIGVNYPSKEIVADLLLELRSEKRAKGRYASHVPEKAAIALIRIGISAPETEGLILGLLQALKEDFGYTVSYEVSKGLSKMGVLVPETKGLLSGLLQGLQNKDKQIRRNAAEILGDIGSVSPVNGLVEKLIQFLQDNDADVRAAVADSLGKVSEIIPATEKLVNCLLQALYKESTWDTLKPIVRALKKICKMTPPMGRKIASGLSTALESEEDDDIRQKATYAVGQISNEIPIPKDDLASSLLTMLQDEEDRVRHAAAIALSKIEVTTLSNAVMEELIKGLLRALQDCQDEEEEDQEEEDQEEGENFNFGRTTPLSEEIMITLGKCGVVAPQMEGLLDGLLQALHGKNHNIRRQAANALNQISAVALPTDKLINGLLRALQDDEDNSIKHTIVMTLGKICRIQTTKSLASDLIKIAKEEKDKEICKAAISILGSIGVNYPLIEQVVIALMQALQSKIPEIRQEAGFALWRIGSETSMTNKVVSDLLQHLRVKKKNVIGQYEAIITLGRIGMQVPSNKELIQGLLQALQSKKNDIQKAAVSALGQIGVIEPLTEGLIIGLLRLKTSSDSGIDYSLGSYIKRVLYKIFDRLPTLFSVHFHFSKQAQKIDSLWINWIVTYLMVGAKYPGIVLHHPTHLQLIAGTKVEIVPVSDMKVMQPLLAMSTTFFSKTLTLENCQQGKTALYPAAKKPQFKPARYPKSSTEFKSTEKNSQSATPDKKLDSNQSLSFLLDPPASSSTSLESSLSFIFTSPDVGTLSASPPPSPPPRSPILIFPSTRKNSKTFEMSQHSSSSSFFTAHITQTTKQGDEKKDDKSQASSSSNGAYSAGLFSSQPPNPVNILAPKAWQAFQKKLQELKKQKYTFTLKREKGDQLLLQFNRKTVWGKKEKIIDELVDTFETLQTLIIENGITAEKPEFQVDWDDWTLTLQAAPMLIDSISKLLKDAVLVASTSDHEVETCRMQ